MLIKTAPNALAIHVDAVSKRFATGQGGYVQALEEVSLEIEPGEFVAIVGPSGCGKSTLLRLIAGLIAPSEGAIEIGAQSVDGPFTDAGIVFQKDLLLGWRTAAENILLQAEMRGLNTKGLEARARELLQLVGLEDFGDRYPAQLSGGMRQRVAICRALLIEFPLLLMDEPFGALDALTRDQLNLDLERLLEHRPTVLFVTHSIDEAVFLSDRVIVMSARPGQITADIKIDLPRPRSLALRDDLAFDEYTARVRRLFVEQGILHENTPPEVSDR